MGCSLTSMTRSKKKRKKCDKNWKVEKKKSRQASFFRVEKSRLALFFE